MGVKGSSTREEITTFSLGIAISIEGKSIWLQPKSVHRIGDIDGAGALFIEMDEVGKIFLSIGRSKLKEDYKDYFA